MKRQLSLRSLESWIDFKKYKPIWGIGKYLISVAVKELVASKSQKWVKKPQVKSGLQNLKSPGGPYRSKKHSRHMDQATDGLTKVKKMKKKTLRVVRLWKL